MYNKSLLRNSAGIQLVVLFAAVCGGVSAEKVDSLPAHDFFSDKGALKFELSISQSALPSLTRSNRDYVPAVLRINETELNPVGVRLKGISGFQNIDQRPCFAIKFNRFISTQRFGGLSKLLLNNCVQDQCLMREAVASSLFADAGVPSARTRYVRASLNGRDLGIYIAVEAMNKDFLYHHFGNFSGNLYEGTMQDINADLELDNGSDKDQRDRKALLQAVTASSLQTRWETINSVLDVDRFLKFSAIDVFLGHGDGYLRNCNNYRLYSDPWTKKMVFIPHGLDRTFILTGAITPSSNSIVMRGLQSVPEGRTAFRAACRQMLIDVWRPDVISNRIDSASRSLDALALDNSEKTRWRACERELQSLVAMRHREILAKLSEPAPSRLRFEPNGSARLSEWFSSSYSGNPRFQVQTNRDEVVLLIQAEALSTGAWRTRFVAPPGNYVFSCKARREQRTSFSPKPLPIVMIKVTGEPAGRALIGYGRWQELKLPISVQSFDRDVELAFELQAGCGDVMLDLYSCRLSKQ